MSEKINNYIKHLPKNLLTTLNVAMVLIIIIFLSPTHFGLTGQRYSESTPIIKTTAAKLASTCANQNKDECYIEEFTKIIKKYDFSFAEHTLYALQGIDEGAKSCHVLSHALTRQAVRKNPDDWLKLMDSVNVNACGSGFLHGVLEAHLGDNPETKFTGELANEMCDRGTDHYRKRMCMHFMGHFFIVDSKDNVDVAVPSCDIVTPSLRFDCFNGLFMEHNQKIALEDHDIAPLPTYTPDYAKSLEEVCYKYSGVQKSACWTEMAEVYAKTFGYDAQTVFNKCYNKNAGSDGGTNCYSKGITILSTYPYNVIGEKLTNICGVYTNNGQYERCVNILVSSLLHYSPKFTIRAIELCSNTDRDKEWCFGELGNQLSTFIPSLQERTELCSPSPEKYRNLCAKVN